MADQKTSDEDDVLATAKKRFEYALERHSHNRTRQKQDIRFAAASPDDPWQWDTRVQKERELTSRPMLTINKIPQHILQVTNDIRQNRPAIRYRPVDDKADPESADILMGIARHIEAHSDADIAYDTAANDAVTHGEGFIRVMADYTTEDSFDQDIFIKRVRRPFQVKMDPDIDDPAGSDAKWCFIDEELTEDEFKRQYPDAEPIDWKFVETDSLWFHGEQKVIVAEYFEKIETSADLLLFASGATMFKGDKLPDGVFAGEKPIKTRKSAKCIVKWRKLNGQQILEERDFPSKFIPVARVVGNEWEVDGKTYISGIVRNAKDSQRMYNVAQSAIVERVMQAPKAPWTVPAEGVEGYEKTWQTANTANHAYLPYNHADEAGNPIPQPVRIAPATVEPGLTQIAQAASDDIKNETGQYDASLGQKSNETSGKAILARQREGDNATFHYIDNLGRAIRHVGRIVLDMIPRIYDTQRVARIMGEDGEVNNVTIDPNHHEALSEFKDEQGEIQRIFNPNIGLYDVYTTSGPSYTTRRLEAVDAMTQMTQGNPGLWQVIGDLLVKNMDWPGAEDMAERLKVTLAPPVQQLLDKDQQIPPEIQQQMEQMKQQLQAAGSAVENMDGEIKRLTQEAQAKQAELEIKANETLVKAYDAETKRLQIMSPAMSPEEIQALVMQTIQRAVQTPNPGASAGEELQELETQEPPESGEQQPQQPDLASVITQALQQQADNHHAALAQVMEAVNRPKTSSMKITSPSGQVYTAEKTEA